MCPPKKEGAFVFNCYKQIFAPWTLEIKESNIVYYEKTMFTNYDSEGFDYYGYSAFDTNGDYVGIGNRVDRLGYTKIDYLSMSEEQYQDCC